MKRRCVIAPKEGQKSVKAGNEATKRVKRTLYEKLHAAFDAIDDCYDIVKEDYGKELDAIYDDLEILVRELELDI